MSLAAPPLSLYVHLPWCVRKCPYCDFNSHARRLGTTVMVITHNAAIARMADRVVHISSGTIGGIERNAVKAQPVELSW